ncbi:esterase family protein [Nostoc sp. FACHB-87]|uniref:alpha/beta hydrolase n=1 Tax=Nostocales TaxID=1161 RepID=UPI00168726A4|nr:MULTISPECIES: alpha/beta hydrolase-fold protein [Nostocales]MBD2452741.1 esterase family protein [Nostoc sp. FACHB-87]MBD2473672.1 esterase family protein [Anabaena sp. FACHB-83]MBD2486336.1 esterase family protein [Aulosira sp. FACHB-615]
MNYKKTLVILISAFTLVGCNYSQGIAAKPTPIKVSILPAQPDVNTLATPLTYQIESYDSQAMPGKRTYGVSLPPGYEQHPQQRYPVIFLLHGGHGEPLDWFSEKKGQALKTLTKLYTTGKLPPSIIITPDGNDKRGSSPYFDPQYIDGPNGKVATAVGDELVKVVQQRYRTLPNPDFWAMGGLSSGGWGAMNVGLHNLQNFSILFSHSGYFQDKSGPQNSPISYIKTLPNQAKKRLRIYLDSGTSDTEELDDAKEFSKVLNQQKIYNLLQQFPGSHTWQYWREHLADSLTFVGEQFRIAEIAHAADNLGISQPKKQKVN